jgi:alcohol dehydrogenase
MIQPFDTAPRTRLVFGAGSLSRAGELAAEQGAKHALIVTDAGIVKTGYTAQLKEVLEAAGLAVSVFDQVHENPTTDDVEACRAVAQTAGIDLFIGLGGGSSLDAAKGANFLLTNGGVMRDYWGWNKAAKPLLPLIAIPTTAGTGSEMQSYALISDAHSHVKMACGDPKAAPRISLLDPELTVSMPPFVAAVTGIDALVHAIESAVTTKRTPISQMYSREAFRLLWQNFSTVMTTPDDLEARGAMQLGAALAGLAIENSMLGAAHSCANPLTAKFDVVHGLAVGIMLPHVMRFNGALPEVRQTYEELQQIIRRERGLVTAENVADWLAKHIEGMLTLAKLPTRLRECGVTENVLPELAEGAAKQWTAQFNPRPLTTDDFLRLYQAAY